MVGTGLAEHGPVSTIKTSLKRSNGFMGPFLDSLFERFVRLELLHVCGNELDYGMVRMTKRSSWNCMKGMWNGTVTMIKCLVISCRAFHMLFVLGGGVSQVFVIKVTDG